MLIRDRHVLRAWRRRQQPIKSMFVEQAEQEIDAEARAQAANEELGRRIRAKNRLAARARRMDQSSDQYDDQILDAADTYRLTHPWCSTHSTRRMAAHIGHRLKLSGERVRHRLRRAGRK